MDNYQRTLRRSTVLVAFGIAAGLLCAGTTPATALTRPASPDSAVPATSQFYCGHGIWAVSTFPARGFNPLAATTGELERNGYPPRPAASDPVAFAQWRRLVTTPGATRSSCAGLREVDRTSGSPLAPAGHPSPATGVSEASSSANWSGYVVHNAAYNDIEANWVVPSAGGYAGTDDYSSSWVGINLGQHSAYPIMQAGSESDYLNGTRDYDLWLEVYPDQPSEIVVDSHIAAGNSVGVHVTYSSTTAAFHIVDDTTGFNQHYAVYGSFSNDGHAEFIYERPSINGSLPYLADAPPAFTSAQATIGSTWHPLGALSSYSYDMYNCAGTQEMASPGGIGSNGYSFAESFKSFGDNFSC
jgi:Peptidase A4 family